VQRRLLIPRGWQSSGRAWKPTRRVSAQASVATANSLADTAVNTKDPEPACRAAWNESGPPLLRCPPDRIRGQTGRGASRPATLCAIGLPRRGTPSAEGGGRSRPKRDWGRREGERQERSYAFAGTLGVMADESPATKQDIQELKTALEKTETRLLAEFWKWARVNDIKVRSVSSHGVDLDARLGLVEERVSELERRRPTS
jgi:hypothetical protein